MYPILDFLIAYVPWWLAVVALVGVQYVGRRHIREHGHRLLDGGWDVTLVLLASACLVVMVFRLVDGDVSPHTIIDPFGVVFLGAAAGTTFKSLQMCASDSTRLWMSLGIKASLLLLLPIIIVPVLVLAFGAKRDGRYRDGTADNVRTSVLGLGSVALVWLIGGLMNDRHHELPG